MSWPSLQSSSMDALWAVVRDRLERQGLDNRGRVRVPDLDAEARLTLKSLLGKSPSATVDLAALETALVDLGVGSDLAGSLAVLGHGVSDEPARRRKARALGAEARAAAHDEAQRWPETWAQEWVADVIRSGAFRDLDADEARGLVANVRRVLDEIDRHNNGDGGALPLSRVELAASVLGDSHLLDNGRRLEAAVRRALGFRLGPTGDDASVWALSGVHSDLTSGPALCWALPVLGGLAGVCRESTEAGIPVYLSRFALLEHPVGAAEGCDVLVVENPRLVEFAAQRRLPQAMVSAAGSPSWAVQLLVRQLLDAGAAVHYHGDFDAMGLALCARMAAVGVRPWRMDSSDYLEALAEADRNCVALPVERSDAPQTPWDPALQDVFDADRRIVHEERLLPHLLMSLRSGVS